METILRDILGIIVLKLNVKDVLNLRATCKRLNDCILGFNKYWFFQYFLKNKYEILLSKYNLKHVHGVKKEMSNGEVFLFPYITCLTLKSCKEVNEFFVKDPEYESWKKEANELGFFNEASEYESAYCRTKYLNKTENFTCTDVTHYDVTSFSNIKPMLSINIIDEKILNCYEPKTEYFKLYVKYMYSRTIIEHMKKKIGYYDKENTISSLDKMENIIIDDFASIKDDIVQDINQNEDEIETLKKQIQEHEKEIYEKRLHLKGEEEESEKNMKEFLRLKEEYNKIFK